MSDYRSSPRGRDETTSRRSGRRAGQGFRVRLRRRAAVEALEPRTLLSLVSWKATADGFWDDAANWDAGRPPATGDDVRIDSSVPLTVTLRSPSADVRTLTSTQPIVVAGGSLVVTQSSNVAGSLTVQAGGTVGGALTFSPGGYLTARGTAAPAGVLDGAVVTGEVRLAGATLLVRHGLTLHGTATLGDPASSAPGVLRFDGSQTLSGKALVRFSGPGSSLDVLNPDDALTLGADVTLRGGRGLVNATEPPGLLARLALDDSLDDSAGRHTVARSSGVRYVDAKLGRGLTLAPGGYVDLAPAPDLNLQRFTLAAWVRPEGNGGGPLDVAGNVILGKSVNASLQSAYLDWRPTDNRFYFAFGNQNDPNDAILSADAFATGEFHHAAATYDGSAFRLYVDGRLEGEKFDILTVPYNDAIPWVVGANPAEYRSGYPRTFGGVIDDVRVYNRALDVNEIRQLVDAQNTGAARSLMDVQAEVVADGADSRIGLNLASVTGTLKATNGGTISLNGDVAATYGPIILTGGGTLSVDALWDGRAPVATDLTGAVVVRGTALNLRPSRLEVGGRDLGAVPAGFLDPYALGRLELDGPSAARLTLTDDVPSPGSAGADALYVGSLVVGAGATLDLNGLKVYARSVRVSGSVVGGTVVAVAPGGPITTGSVVSGTVGDASHSNTWTLAGHTGDVVDLVVATSGTTAGSDLGLGDVSVVDASGTVLASASNTSAGSDIRLGPLTLPAEGTYRIVVARRSGTPGGDYTLSTWDARTTTRTLAVNADRTGSLASPLRFDDWTFTAAVGAQVRLRVLANPNGQARFTLLGPGGLPVVSDVTADTGLLTLPAGGGYVLRVAASRPAFGAYAFRLDQTDVVALTPGVTSSPVVMAAGQSQLFQVGVGDGAPLRFAVTGPAGSQLDVYLRRGQPPTPGDYDLKADAPGASPTLLTPFASPGTWYALVTAALVPGGGGALTARADVLRMTIGDTAPARSSADAATTLEVTGLGFRQGTTVALVAAGGAVYPLPAQVTSPTRILATLAAGSVPAGTFAVRVTSPDGSASDERPAALQLVPAGRARLTTDLVLPGALGNESADTIYIHYANAGDAPMPAPLLELTVTRGGTQHALLTRDPALRGRGLWTAALPDGFSHSVQILASGRTPGVLQPGESVDVPVYWCGWLRADQDFPFWYDPYSFQLGVLDADSTAPVDWAGMKAGLRPPTISTAAWDVIYDGIAAATGTTWGDYVRLLSGNATYLAGLGQTVTDIAELWQFVVQQRSGLGPVATLASAVDAAAEGPGLALAFGRTFAASLVGRDATGPFGRGWFSNWQTTLAVEPDGTVAVNGPAGSQRRFQPDVRGVLTPRYFAAPGDNGVLVALPGGGYRVEELGGGSTTFRPDGRVDFVADASGNRVTAGYDPAGRLASLTHSGGESLALTYNTAGLLDRVADAHGRSTTYGYDPTNQYLTTVTAYDGRVTRYTYQTDPTSPARHAITSIASPDGTHTVSTYDAAGRVASVAADGGANRVAFAYGPGGRVTATDALNAVTTYDYDQRGLLTRTTDPLGRTTTGTFDSQANLTALTDPLGQVATFRYDTRGNLVAGTDVLGHTTEYLYTTDRLNRLAQVVDARGNPLSYAYDARGNLQAVTYADGSRESLAVDPLGNVTQATNRRGHPIGYTYEADGRLLSKTYQDGGVVTYAYDARGNLVSAADAGGTITLTYDSADRLTRVAYPGGLFLAYTYDAPGRRTRMVDQDGSATNYRYDSLGRLAGLSDEAGAPVLTYTYDAVGRLSREDKGNGTYTTYAYDAAGQLLSLVNHAPNGTPNSRFDSTYDDLGRRTGMATLDGSWAYTHDATGQLTRAVFRSTNPAVPDEDLLYEYDAVGNRVRAVENGITTRYTTNALNQYVAVGDAVNTYDADGNLVASSGGEPQTYAYDDENNLIRAVISGVTTGFTYNALGDRARSVCGGTTTDYVFDPAGAGLRVGEYVNGGAATKYQVGFVREAFRTAGGAWQHLDLDPLGSTAAVTGPTGTPTSTYRYAPFGVTLSVSGTHSVSSQFLGGLDGWSLAPGVVMLGARAYSVRTGSFLSTDPIHADLTRSTYGYALNSPVDLIDPSGLEPPWWLFGWLLQPIQKNLNAEREHEAATYSSSNDTDPESRAKTQYHLRQGQRYMQEGGALAAGAALLVEAHGIATDPEGTVAVSAAGAGRGAYGGFRRGGASGALTGATEGVIPFEISRWAAEQAASRAFRPGTPHRVPKAIPPRPHLVFQWNPRLGAWVASRDPNSLTGTDGRAAARQALAYRIDFENSSQATAPAQRVLVTLTLDPGLDPAELRLTGLGFGDTVIAVPDGSRAYHFLTPVMAGGKSFGVDVEAGVDVATGRMVVSFQSLDPATGLPPDVLTGFLPPEDGTGRGQGFVTYTVRPKAGLPTGTLIRNVATIVFDANAPIDTNQVDEHDRSKGIDPAKEARVVIDAGAPTSAVDSLPSTSASTDFTVSWWSEDDAGGSGVASTDVHVSVDGGPLTAWLTGTSEASAVFHGLRGHRYGFASVATDAVGNRGTEPLSPQAVTSVAARVGSKVSWQGGPAAVLYGASTRFALNVGAAEAGAGTPTGTVQFFVNGAALGGAVALVGGVAVSPALAGAGVGSYAVTARYSGDALFEPATAAALAQVITPAPLTVRVVDQARAYGASNPPFAVAYSGFVNGDTPASLRGSLTFGTNASPSSLPGRYPVVVAGLTSPNYAIRFDPGTLTVLTPPPTHLVAAEAQANKQGLLTGFLLRFDARLDPASARSVASYQLVAPGRDGRFGTRDDVAVVLGPPSYPTGDKAVRLQLRSPYAVKTPLQLRVVGVGRGVRDTFNRLIDGDRNGLPGGTAVATVRRVGQRITAGL